MNKYTVLDYFIVHALYTWCESNDDKCIIHHNNVIDILSLFGLDEVLFSKDLLYSKYNLFLVSRLYGRWYKWDE